MSAFYDDPNDYDFGLAFNYAVWTPNSELLLCNVPWDAMYRDAPRMASKEAFNAYIDGLPTAQTKLYEDVSYVKVNQPIKVDIPFNRAMQFNYVRVRNQVQPISVGGPDIAKDFYYFITDIRFINPNCTELVVQLDAWSTFIYDVQIQNCYVKRGHFGIAASNAFDNYGRTYLTIPEGLDTGTEMRIMPKYDAYSEIMNVSNYAVLACSVNDLAAEPGTRDDPIRNTAPGSVFGGVPSGASYYLWENANDFMQFMSDFSDKPWVTAGITSITVIPNPALYDPTWQQVWDTMKSPIYHGVLANAADYFENTNQLAPNWRSDTDILNWLPSRYRHLLKFFTSPYMVIEMTTYTGTPLVIKPEMWNDANASVHEIFMPVPPSQRVLGIPVGYNAAERQTGETGPQAARRAEWLDFTTVIANLPSLAIVNENSIMAFASQANNIAYQRQMAGWSLDIASRSNQLSYDQATGAIETGYRQGNIGRQAAWDQTELGNMIAWQGTAAGAANSIIGGGIGGGIGGALSGAGSAMMGAINTGLSTTHASGSTRIGNAASLDSQLAGMQQSRMVRDTNKNLADYAASGNYANAIAGIEAKNQDMALIQPSTVGQVGGELLNLVTQTFGIYLRWKMIDESAIRRIGDIWLRFGYGIQRFMTGDKIPDDLHCMSKFTYWEMSETYLTGNVPENYKQTLRGILEKGVTVWKNPAHIGVTDIADNTPLTGIAF